MTDRPDLDAITARAAAATPGPWGTTTTWRDELVVTRPGGGEIATLGDPDDTQVHADAAFISHARADVDALLAEVRRLRRELARAQQTIHQLSDEEPHVSGVPADEAALPASVEVASSGGEHGWMCHTHAYAEQWGYPTRSAAVAAALHHVECSRFTHRAIDRA